MHAMLFTFLLRWNAAQPPPYLTLPRNGVLGDCAVGACSVLRRRFVDRLPPVPRENHLVVAPQEAAEKHVPVHPVVFHQ